MDITDIQEILRLTAGGASRQSVASQVGVAKSTVQSYLDRVKATGLTLEQAIALAPSSLLQQLGGNTFVRTGYLEPDFENTYVRNNVPGKLKKTVKALWQSYVASAPEGSVTLGYKGFCKSYARFCEDLPASCREVQLINHWHFGDVAMIDYSGDGLCYRPEGANSTVTAQIFVAVLPASGYIFCCATPHQTRDDWLDAQVKMMNFFGGVPRQIYLDNSTSLVVRADKYDPTICSRYREFCDYYGTIPVAVRPGKPKDKAMVENAVKQVQRSVLQPLQGREFFSLEEMNKALLKELQKLNDRPLTTRSDGISRSVLMQEERIVLRPLPVMPFELSSESKILKVQKGNVVRFNDTRYSVPLGYIGRKVRVIKSCRNLTVSIFDLQSGERIWEHYLTSRQSQDIILAQHMPEHVRAAMQTKEELVALISQCGPASRTLCQRLMEQNHGEVARKILRGVNHYRINLGTLLFESCCAATLKRATPSFKVLQEEIEAAVSPRKHKTKEGITCDRSELDAADVRGADYYSKRINKPEK